MKESGWLCRTRPKKVPNLGKTYHVTDNKLDRDFQVDKPMEKLVTDITYLYFGNCRLYLSSTVDLYNREIVAYTISECQDTDFVPDTLNQLEIPQGVLLHSDPGSVYTSKAYYQACIEKGITRSMSRKETPADNACIEWFHPVLKSEIFYLHKWRNLTKAPFRRAHLGTLPRNRSGSQTIPYQEPPDSGAIIHPHRSPGTRTLRRA